jgi:hypothetical protein
VEVSGPRGGHVWQDHCFSADGTSRQRGRMTVSQKGGPPQRAP